MKKDSDFIEGTIKSGNLMVYNVLLYELGQGALTLI